MYPTLPHPVTTTKTTQQMNLGARVLVEETVNGGSYLNEYIYVRAGAILTINRGCCLQGDHPGAVYQVFTATMVGAQFIGINRVAFADNDYGFLLCRGAIDLSFIAGALRKMVVNDADGVLSAAAIGTGADNDVGIVLDDGTAIIGWNQGGV